MPKSTNLNFTQEIEVKGVQLTSASTTALQTVYTAGTNDAVLKSLTATSDDSAAVNLKVVINDGSTDFLLGTVRIAATSGTDGAAATVDILGSSLLPGLPRDLNNRTILPLKNGHILKVGALATSGTDGAAATVDILGSSLLPGLPRDLNNRTILPLKNGHILKVGALATMTSAKTCNIVAVVEEY